MQAAQLSASTRAIIGGVDSEGRCYPVEPGAFDLLLTVAGRPRSPWVSVRDPIRVANAITAAVARAPIAASTAARVLRIGEPLPFSAALELESLAYSTLLGGGEHRRWRAGRVRAPMRDEPPFLRVERAGDLLTITLASPHRRNAISAGMRDALHEALCAALDDPTRPRVLLRGEGACFSVGGALEEFGTATDFAYAHAVRTLRSCTLRLHELGDRASAMLHGACIGSGVEIPTATARRFAAPNAFFQLPELAMGLMPGAGGTASIARAIGRHRTCFMLLSGRRIRQSVATSWGLVEDGPG